MVTAMQSEPLSKRLLGTIAPGPTLFIRLVVGWSFLSEGIQKFLFPAALGVGSWRVVARAQVRMPT
jgi:hypothetical protein